MISSEQFFSVTENDIVLIGLKWRRRQVRQVTHPRLRKGMHSIFFLFCKEKG